MINLGEKKKTTEFYDATPSTDEKKETIKYPTVTLPIKILDKVDVELGDEFTIILKGKVERIEKSKFYNEVSFSVTEGKVEGGEKKEKKEKSLLDEAS